MSDPAVPPPSTTSLDARLAKIERAVEQSGWVAPAGRWLRWLPVLAISHFVLTVPAFLISVALVYATYVQADATRKIQQASAWPYLSFTSGNVNDQNQREIDLTITNNGVGPARIMAMEVSLNGRPAADARDLIRSCCRTGEQRPVAFFSAFVSGQVMRPGDEIAFVRLPYTDESARVYERLNRARGAIRVRLCYCSVFDECWVSDTVDRSRRQVDQCPVDWRQYREIRPEETRTGPVPVAATPAGA